MKTNLDKILETYDLTLFDLFCKAFFNEENGDYCQMCPLCSTCDSFVTKGGNVFDKQGLRKCVNEWLGQNSETLKEKVARLEKENADLRTQIKTMQTWRGL